MVRIVLSVAFALCFIGVAQAQFPSNPYPGRSHGQAPSELQKCQYAVNQCMAEVQQLRKDIRMKVLVMNRAVKKCQEALAASTQRAQHGRCFGSLW